MFLTRRTKRLSSLWRTAAFRLAIIFASIFGVGASTMLLLLDVGVGRYAEDELRNALRHQMAILRADAQLEGGAALVSILKEHVRTDTVNRYRYLVIPVSGAAFNSGLPNQVSQIQGFGLTQAVAMDIASVPSLNSVKMMVLTEHMNDGTFIAVGRESSPLDDLRISLHKITIWASIIVIVMAALAAIIAGSFFLRRLERVNQTAGRIMDGNLSERIPAIGFGQEFHTLTDNLNAMLDRLEAAMNSMRQLSTDLAHDLRMPLTRLRNQLEEFSPVTELQTRQIEGAIEEADELLSLFNAMLRLARLEAGSVSCEMTIIDLSSLIIRVVEAYQPAAEEGGRRIVNKVNGQYFITGNASLLNQLMANLIDNAICHTPNGTIIEICINIDLDNIKIIVQDNGNGVSDFDLHHLKDRFYRADNSRAQPGTGLGLTLVAAIVDLHHGDINIINRNPGLVIEISLKR